MNEKIVVYDIEIVNAIPDRKTSNKDGIKYCKGWGDYANMGVSVIGAYDYAEDRTRVFCKDNIDEFFSLVKSSNVLVGFNNIPFDNKVLDYVAQMPPDSARYYDILRELWVASGLTTTFSFPTHMGFGLDVTCRANGLSPKTGDGALAPVQWQRGEIGTVIDYCLNDVLMTKQLLDKINTKGWLTSPKDGKALNMPQLIENG